MEGTSRLEACLPSLYALDPYTAPPPPLPPFLAPLPNQQHKLLQMPLVVQEQSVNHGVMFSSDHGGGGLYPLLPGIPFCHSAAAAAASDKPETGFAPLAAGEVGTSAARAGNEVASTTTTTATRHGASSWWKGAEKGKMKVRRKMREPRFCFQTRSDVDVLDDGYKWRKYGQKVVKNSLHPSFPFWCSDDSIPDIPSPSVECSCQQLATAARQR
ncbi:hypothetical protein BRADI_5g17395v3 [Brachypodium distachyon]|uniref:WRKY domain-containing protein n=1 Tax=Brachypodium distachyon TaxID=15368 RepID=A0A0Q3E7P4_BRADI|nr:hypothetical protein BRADI_5g17395v3 [Brachypodium distachyon]